MCFKHPSRLWAVSLLSLLSLGAAGRDVPLVDAVKTGDLKTVRSLLQQKTDVNAPEPDGTTALHWAAHRDALDSATLLIRAGANVKAANRYGVTPLALASANGNAAMLEKLLTAGADPNSASVEGDTPLMIAARTGKVDAVKTLLAHGANVQAKEKGRGTTAVMWAAAENNAAAAQVLVENGADLQARATNGFSPLMFSAREGGIDVARTFLAAKANVNDKAPDGTSVLVLAIMNAHYELAALLLDNGADPNVPDPRGSALHVLAWVRRPGYANQPPRVPTGNLDSLDLAKALLAHGANPNVRVAWKEIRFDRNAGAVKLPPNVSVGRNFLTFNGATPFYLAAKHCDVALMRLLAANGADPVMPTVQNVTPLMAAAGLGFWDGESPGIQNGVPESETLEAVKLAVELGNDVNAASDFGDVALEGDPVGLLRAHPLNLAKFPETAMGDMRWSGSTALHGAVLRGADTVVQFLADKGARVDARNKLGWTALMLAEGVFTSNTEKSWPSTAALLRKLMAERGLNPELYTQTAALQSQPK